MLNPSVDHLENTTFLNRIISEIESYYGVNFNTHNKESIVGKLFVEICKGDLLLPYKFNLRYKGEIVQGVLGNIRVLHLFSIRHMSSKETFNTEDWENCLVPYSDMFTYCRDNETIYIGIDSLIADYLDKHNLSGNIYNIVCGNSKIPNAKGETAKVYDMYIKKEKAITAKKCVLSSTVDLGKVGIDNPYWALHYIEKLLLDDKILGGLTENKEKLIKVKAKYHNIIESDLYYRYASGVPFEEAIRIGIEESSKYGFGYLERPDNINFINYLYYLIKQENNNGEGK